MSQEVPGRAATREALPRPGDARVVAEAVGDMIVDLFAGPGGWDFAAAELGMRPVGIEWDESACLTRRAAGHRTIRTDVKHYPTAPFIGAEGVIASPPCPDFSTAGKRAGITGKSGRLGRSSDG